MALTLRTDEELEAALSRLTASLGTSRQEVLRRAVLELDSRSSRRRRIDLIVDDVLVEYADALDRLGKV